MTVILPIVLAYTQYTSGQILQRLMEGILEYQIKNRVLFEEYVYANLIWKHRQH
jgi:hypothetical protein